MGIQDVSMIGSWTPARLTRYIRDQVNQSQREAKASLSGDAVYVHNSLTFSSGDFQSADTVVTRPSIGILAINGLPIVTTGAGGAISQITSRTTGVTLNKLCGQITLVGAVGSATWTSFTVTNSTVAPTDVIYICQATGANTYNAIVTAVAAGSFKVSVSSVVGTANEAPVLNFIVFKSANS